MMELLATHGPLSAVVDATLWQNYMGGIIQYHCGRARNHCIEIVGYNLTGEQLYLEHSIKDSNITPGGYTKISSDFEGGYIQRGLYSNLF